MASHSLPAKGLESAATHSACKSLKVFDGINLFIHCESACSSLCCICYFFYVRHSGRKAVSQIFQVSIVQFLKKVSFFFQFDFQEKVLCIIQKGNRNKKFAFTDIKGFDSEVSFASCSDKL